MLHVIFWSVVLWIMRPILQKRQPEWILVQPQSYISDVSSDLGCELLRRYLGNSTRIKIQIAESCPKIIRISIWYQELPMHLTVRQNQISLPLSFYGR